MIFDDATSLLRLKHAFHHLLDLTLTLQPFFLGFALGGFC
jgi:hypothetical protein